MSEQIYTYRSQAFNLNQAYYYTLLLQVSANSFSFAITYKKQLLAWAVNCNLDELTSPQRLHDELTAVYKKKVISLPSAGFSLIPTVLFNENQVTDYARLLDVKPTDKVLVQVFDDENHIIYKVEGNLLTGAQRFGLDNIVFANKGWITAVAQSNPLVNELYLYVNNSSAEFLYYKDGKVRFYNTFDFKSEDDLAYYASVVTDEIGLVAQDLQLMISGGIQRQDSYGKRLAYFFPAIVVFDPKIIDLPAEVPSQQLLTLASLSLCGSLEVH